MSELLHSRMSRRAGIGLAAVLASVTSSHTVFADEGTPSASTTECSCGSSLNTQTLVQSATPAASPIASDDLPPGPLGDRIQWLLDLINGAPTAITGDAIATEFTEDVLSATPAEELAAVLTEVAEKAGPLSIQDGQIATSLEEPPSTAVFRAEGRDGLVVQITLGIDTTSGLIHTLVLKPLGFTLNDPAATPAT